MAGRAENGWSRREVLRGATLAGTAISVGLKSESAAAEPALETTRIRIHDAPITCFAPVYIAEGLLKAEGFTDVQYIKTPLNEGPTKALAEGKIDITQNDTAGHLMELDAGAPVVILGGIHTGCWELFANDSVRTLRDLKGKTVAAPERSSRQAFVAGLATFVGLNPLKDITWINHEPGKSMQLFAEGKIDAETARDQHDGKDRKANGGGTEAEYGTGSRRPGEQPAALARQRSELGHQPKTQ